MQEYFFHSISFWISCWHWPYEKEEANPPLFHIRAVQPSCQPKIQGKMHERGLSGKEKGRVSTEWCPKLLWQGGQRGLQVWRGGNGFCPTDEKEEQRERCLPSPLPFWNLLESASTSFHWASSGLSNVSFAPWLFLDCSKHSLQSRRQFTSGMPFGQRHRKATPVFILHSPSTIFL